MAGDLLVAVKVDVEDYNLMKIANSTIFKSLELELAEVTSVKEDF